MSRSSPPQVADAKGAAPSNGGNPGATAAPPHQPQPEQRSLSGRLMAALAQFCDRRAMLIIVLSFVAAFLSVALAILHLGFDPDRNNLIGSQAAYNQVFLRFKEDFPQGDDIVVLVKSREAERNRAAVD